jgi:hypothetical protein
VSDGLRVTDWACVGGTLVANGSVRIQGAVNDSLARKLIDATRAPWQTLPKEQGPVQQNGFASYMSVAEAEVSVRNLAADIVRELTSSAPLDVPAIPHFNEVSWTRYPAATGRITTHRDPAPFDGIIAIATLSGHATFSVWGGAVHGTPDVVLAGGTPPTEWDASAGDLILLRGNGWPTPDARCPMHEVSAPADGERTIMTFRHNTRGAGGGYDVEHP